ncbi:MAG: Xaa-Pro peptidase family protein [Candidatus Woesearchaeota archaeon]
MFQKLQKVLNADLALFFNADFNIAYFAGVKPNVACLVIPASGKPKLFVPGFEAARMAKASTIDVVQVGRDFLKEVCRQFPAKKIGIIPNAISHAIAQKVKVEWNAELVSIEEQCQDLRLTKSAEEISRITKACAITDALFQEICSNMHKFKTERDVFTFLNMRISQFGFEPSFPAIVASGKNSATPHHIPTSAKLKGFTVIDFGIIYRNYCSDITRTVFVGTPSEKQRKVYERLLSVQEKCIEKMMPGVVLEDIDDFAHREIGPSMIHCIGHSLGIEVHDVQPRPWTLQPGNVITAEPGTYADFGIRIEDDVLVTEKKPVVLTHAPKNLIVCRRVVNR